jgi:hypothetical protein
MENVNSMILQKRLSDGESVLSIKLHNRFSSPAQCCEVKIQSTATVDKSVEDNGSISGVSSIIGDVESEAKKTLYDIEMRKRKRALMRKLDLHLLPILSCVV